MNFISQKKGMKLDINNRKNMGKCTSILELKNTLLNTQMVIEESKREIKKYFEKNENETTTCQNLWDITKAALRRQFIAENAGVKKRRKIFSQYLNLLP